MAKSIINTLNTLTNTNTSYIFDSYINYSLLCVLRKIKLKDKRVSVNVIVNKPIYKKINFCIELLYNKNNNTKFLSELINLKNKLKYCHLENDDIENYNKNKIDIDKDELNLQNNIIESYDIMSIYDDVNDVSEFMDLGCKGKLIEFKILNIFLRKATSILCSKMLNLYYNKKFDSLTKLLQIIYDIDKSLTFYYYYNFYDEFNNIKSEYLT